ncbi:MAG: hypothetical protein IMZ62_06605, partial [Chloroflexi bacterium]|nr:hypothetical protein [Chloroflexota bacterium]
MSYSQHHSDVWDVYVLMYRATAPLRSDYQYENDEVQRLTKVSNSHGITIPYAYDNSGNRTQKIVTSQLTIAAGPANPVSHGIANDAADEPILQLTLSVSADEDLVLKGLELQASGMGNDATAISEVKLWNGGVVLGTCSFAVDNGTVAFVGLSETIPAGSTANLLVTYKFQGASLPAQQGDTFHAAVTDHLKVTVEGSVSGNHIYALGLPVDGATLTISTDTSAPAFSGLGSAVAQDGAVRLEWPAATDSSLPVTYRIWCATSSFGGAVSGPPNFSTYDLSYLVPGLVNGQAYYFVVRSEDAVGNRDSNVVERSATPQATTHTLTVNAVNGSVTRNPDQPNYEHGTAVTLTAIPDDNYRFTGWTDDVPAGLQSFNPLTVIVDANKSVTATFERATGTVRLVASMSDVTWTVTDGDGVTHPGSGPSELPAIPTGTILCDWTPKEGYTSPGAVASSLSEGSTVTFEGTYIPVLTFSTPMSDLRRYVEDAAEFGFSTSGGLSPLHYQWKFDDGQGSVIDVGDGAPALAIPSVAIANAGYYWCEVTDAVPSTYTSNAAHLEVAEPLEVSGTLPEEVRKYVGDTHSLTAAIQGGFEPKTYQWFNNDEPAGPDSNEWSFQIETTGDAGNYRCEVTDDLGSSV